MTLATDHGHSPIAATPRVARLANHRSNVILSVLAKDPLGCAISAIRWMLREYAQHDNFSLYAIIYVLVILVTLASTTNAQPIVHKALIFQDNLPGADPITTTA